MTRLLTLSCRLSPHGFCTTQTAALLAFTATVRVVHRIHGISANCRSDAHPTRAAGLADNNEPMLVIRRLADRCPRGADDTAHFGRRQFKMRVACVLCH